MTFTRTIISAALAAGLTVSVTNAAFAGHRNYNVGPNHAHNDGKGPNKGGPPERRCVKSFYGEKECNVAPNGRQFGPEAYDYAVGTGNHIQR